MKNIKITPLVEEGPGVCVKKKFHLILIWDFPFHIVRVSVKIRDLRAHFALAGQTHSRAGLARWVIWYPALIQVSARFCSAMINVTKSHIQHRGAQQAGQAIDQWEALIFTNWPMRGQLCVHVTHDQWRLSWLGHVMRDSWHAFMTQYPVLLIG